MKQTIVILHGWGSMVSGERYSAIKEIFEKKGFGVFTPDMPGFGKSQLKKEELFFDDYVQFVKEFITQKKLKKIILIGHSFGGRVAIRFTALYPGLVSKLILVGASGIPRPLPSLKKKIVYFVTKLTRSIFEIPPLSLFYKIFRKLIYYSIGEMDYYKSGKLSKTFKNVYKVSIVDDLEKIHIPTIIIWGEKDIVTPIADGQFMNKHILNSKLIVVSNATHRLPYESPNIFVKKVLNSIK